MHLFFMMHLMWTFTFNVWGISAFLGIAEHQVSRGDGSAGSGEVLQG